MSGVSGGGFCIAHIACSAVHMNDAADDAGSAIPDTSGPSSVDASAALFFVILGGACP